jgi:hypothetical protein
MRKERRRIDRIQLYEHARWYTPYKPRVGVTPARLLENKGRGRKQTKDPQSPLRFPFLAGMLCRVMYYLFGFGRYGCQPILFGLLVIRHRRRAHVISCSTISSPRITAHHPARQDCEIPAAGNRWAWECEWDGDGYEGVEGAG